MKQEIFSRKKAELLGRPNFSELMIKTGLADKPFVLIGMMIDNDNAVMLSEGIDCFVANGYPPSDAPLNKRNSHGCVKYVISNTYRVIRNGDDVKLEYVCEDVDVLFEERIAKIFAEIIAQKGYKSGDKVNLRNLDDQSTVWEVWTSDGRNHIVLRAYVDSGRLEECVVAPDQHPSQAIVIDEVIDSCYSRYKVIKGPGGIVLIRDEWNRKLSGIGAFIS